MSIKKLPVKVAKRQSPELAKIKPAGLFKAEKPKTLKPIPEKLKSVYSIKGSTAKPPT
jgi:hypothetical protein